MTAQLGAAPELDELTNRTFSSTCTPSCVNREFMQPSLTFLSASKLAAMLRAGEITSRQTVEAYFAQIREQNPTYNAIVTVNEANALAQADQADQAMRDGKPCGPLHGVPITILADLGENVDISKLKIAWTDNFGGVPVSAEIKDKLHAFVNKLAQAGATVQKSEPQGMDYNEIWETWGSFVGAQGNYDMSNVKRSIGHLFSKSTVRNIPMQRRIVGPISVRKLMQAFELQSKYITRMDNFLSEYDVWLCPVSATTAFKHHAHSKMLGDFKIYSTPLQVDGADIHYYVATQSYTTVFSTTNSPVVSMPIGLGPSGLPVNIQVAGKRYSDRRLLRVAKVLDNYTDKFLYPLQ